MLALRESERKKRAILNALPDLMLVVSVEGTVLESKLDEQASLFIVPGPYTGRRLSELFASPLERMLMDQLTQVIAQKAGATFEFRSGADMHARHYEARMVLSGAAEVLVLIRDVTERRQAEEELQSSLHEKEALLKEIHHRVKNNLQIISSLLSLQSQQIKNPKALGALTESQGRVRSMALIHEQLYQSHDLGQIDFGQYVRDLTAHLFRTYKTEGEYVTLSVEVHEVFLDVDQAIPCGMIINELVSNCLKHAFPRQRKGTVLIAARREKDGQLCLVVEDSGKGIPVDIDLENTPSLGLKLVRMLSDQLKGTLTHANQEGTSFHLRFRPHPVKPV
jgi:two-component sensor histidine kinase